MLTQKTSAPVTTSTCSQQPTHSSQPEAMPGSADRGTEGRGGGDTHRSAWQWEEAWTDQDMVRGKEPGSHGTEQGQRHSWWPEAGAGLGGAGASLQG